MTPPPITSAKFCWKKSKGTIEASDLRWRAFPRHFDVCSTRTGRIIRFHHHHTEIEEAEGDVLFAIYRDREDMGLEITVLND